MGSFVTWVDASSPPAIAVGLALCFAAGQLIVLGHELGHAAVGILRTEGLVGVRVGRAPGRWKCRLGRLRLEMSLLPALNGPDGLAQVHARLGRKSHAVIVLAGPAAGSLVAADLLLYGLRYQVTPLIFAGGVGGVMNLANLIPFKRRGHRSDGARLLELFRARGTPLPADPLADAVSRWGVLAANVRNVVTPEQLLQLSGAPVAVGYRPGDESEAPADLWKLAVAGWCWREAQRPDVSSIREEVLDERHAAARREARRNEIAVSAARELAVSRKEEPELNEAFTRLRPRFQHPRSPDDQERFAFRFGVALHDVEHLAG